MSGNNPEQWRSKLSAEQFHVCWEKGTERPTAAPCCTIARAATTCASAARACCFTRMPNSIPAAVGPRSIGPSRGQ